MYSVAPWARLLVEDLRAIDILPVDPLPAEWTWQATINDRPLQAPLAIGNPLSLRQMRCRSGNTIMGHPRGDVAGKLLRVSLSDYPEPEMRARLLAVRTGLTLPREEVDELIAAGETMIRRNAGAIAGFLDPAPQAAAVARGQ